MFCPKCGSLMRPMKKGGKTVLVCIKCGYTEDPNPKDREKYVIKEKMKTVGDNIVVIDKVEFSDDVDYTIMCPKCGHKGAYYKNYYDLSSDSGFTIYKCVKCGHTWREED